jgi:hypothetical protein
LQRLSRTHFRNSFVSGVRASGQRVRIYIRSDAECTPVFLGRMPQLIDARFHRARRARLSTAT